jgi:hypothetical protein
MVALFFFGVGAMIEFTLATTMLTEFMPGKSSSGVAVSLHSPLSTLLFASCYVASLQFLLLSCDSLAQQFYEERPGGYWRRCGSTNYRRNR